MANRSRLKNLFSIFNPMLLGWSLLTGFFLLLHLVYSNQIVFPVDDAYISFRYAENFSEGFGLVYNLGERVEGYSNFLWVLLISFASKIGITPPLAARLFSLASILSIIFLFFSIKKKKDIDVFTRGSIVLLTLIFVLSPHTISNTLSGLESPLVTALIFGGLLAVNSSKGFLAPFLFFLASLTRPETVLLSGIIMASELSFILLKQKGNDTNWRNAALSSKSIRWLIAFVLPYSIYFLWRFFYFGHMVPNSVYAKSGFEFSVLVSKSIPYISNFIFAYWPMFIFAITGSMLVVIGKIKYISPVFIIAIFWIVLSNFYFGSGDPYTSFARYLFPVLPLVLFVGAAGIGYVLSISKEKNPFVLLSTILIIFLLISFQMDLIFQKHNKVNREEDNITWGYFQDGLSNFFSQDYSPHLNESLKNKDLLVLHYLADWLIKYSKPGEVIATAEVGIAPYYSRIKVIDTFGLVDEQIAHSQGVPGNKADPDYVFGKNPDYFSIKTHTKNLFGGIPSDSKLLKDYRMRSHYDFVGAFPYGEIRLLLFRKRKVPRLNIAYDFCRNFSHDRVFF